MRYSRDLKDLCNLALASPSWYLVFPEVTVFLTFSNLFEMPVSGLTPFVVYLGYDFLGADALCLSQDQKPQIMHSSYSGVLLQKIHS